MKILIYLRLIFCNYCYRFSNIPSLSSYATCWSNSCWLGCAVLFTRLSHTENGLFLSGNAMQHRCCLQGLLVASMLAFPSGVLNWSPFHCNYNCFGLYFYHFFLSKLNYIFNYHHRYTMTKSTSIIFILGFALFFKLEKKVNNAT